MAANAFTAAAALLQQATGSGNSNVVVDDQQTCGIWLAPSTIQGAGLGMFAGRNFKRKDELLVGGDSVVAISDLKEHGVNSADQSDFLWDEYTWNSGALKMDGEGVAEVNVASPGFGAAANCFLPVYNVDEWYPTLVDSGLHRTTDPGAGASTVFHHRKSFAKRDIGAGEEFFVSYGGEWFETRPKLGPIPLYDDLESGTALLKKYTLLTLKNSTLRRAVWDTFVKHTAFNESRVLKGAFHHTENELAELAQHDNNVTTARIADSRRTLAWLEEFGTCGDHIGPGRSTIPQAGQGAFSTRKLAQGTIIAQLPMIHVANRSRFDMFRLGKNAQGGIIPVDSVVVGQQLLLNYCYGHGESTLLLCPYGPMVNYVNHASNSSNATTSKSNSSTSASTRLRPNVELRWATRGGNHMPDLLKRTVKELEESDATAKLAMEFVATREILKGEEILLDYGDEWESAWNAHVASFQSNGNKPYTSAANLNSMSRLRTVFEEAEEQMYPHNVRLLCDSGVHLRAAEAKLHLKKGTLNSYLWELESEWRPCDILRFNVTDSGEIFYTVHMYQQGDDGKVTNGVLVEEFPRLAFHFVDRPYTADAYLPSAFRHDIRIPDEIFPNAWRNLRETTWF